MLSSLLPTACEVDCCDVLDWTADVLVVAEVLVVEVVDGLFTIVPPVELLVSPTLLTVSVDDFDTIVVVGADVGPGVVDDEDKEGSVCDVEGGGTPGLKGSFVGSFIGLSCPDNAVVFTEIDILLVAFEVIYRLFI